MTSATFSFGLCAAVVLASATGAMVLRRPSWSLVSFAVALVAAVLPFAQLDAPAVAGTLLLMAGLVVVLLGLGDASGSKTPPRRRASLVFALPASAGVAAVAWMLLATGSRQFVDELPTPRPGLSIFGERALFAAISGDFALPFVLVGLLALCGLVAAALALAKPTSGADPAPSTALPDP